MSSKNITVFETTYEKVLSIINKVKDFIKNNTKNFQSIIDELDWISKVITNKTLYSYDINKAKLSDDNSKFSDFLTKYNEEIINLNKKHILGRGILSFKTNKEFLKKPSLILKKISTNELTGLNYNDKNTISSQNTVFNPLGKWLLNIVNKSQEENVKTNPNENNNINTKILYIYKNKKANNEIMNKSSSLTSITNYQNQTKETKKDNKIKQTIYKNKNRNNSSHLRNKKNFNFYSVNKTMERYFKNEMEQLRKKNMQKSMFEKKYNNMNNMLPANKVDPESLNILIEKHLEFMKTIIDKDFNIFELKKLVGYKNVLPLMCHFMFKILGLIDPKIISIKKFVPFLINVSDGYLESTLYHNSLHGADVCHSLFLYILNSNLEEICETTV